MLAYAATANGTTSTTVTLDDIIGSAIGLVNPAGIIATTFSYEPFGAVTPTGSATTYPYLFAGMEYDPPTGLYHTLARYYSPSLQRFLSEDPLNFGGGDVNLFGYAQNNPVNGTDPLGLNYGFYGYAGPAVGDVVLPNGQFVSGVVVGVVSDNEGMIIGFMTSPIGGTAQTTSMAVGGGCTGKGGCFPPATGLSDGTAMPGIVLAQVDDEPPPEDEGGGPPRTLEGWGAQQIEINIRKLGERLELQKGEVNRGDLKVLSKSALKGVNAEGFKEDIVGPSNGGKYNIAGAPKGDIFLVPVRAGAGQPIPTGYTLQELLALYGR